MLFRVLSMKLVMPALVAGIHVLKIVQNQDVNSLETPSYDYVSVFNPTNSALAFPSYCATALYRFQLIDQLRNQSEPAAPELGVARVQAERREQFGMMLGSPSGQHLEIALGKTALGLFVNGIERVHEAIAECIGINIEGRMHEMRDIRPEGLVARLELDRRPKTFALHRHPQIAELVGRELAVATFAVHLPLETVERDLAHHRVDHVLNLGCEHGLALFSVGGLR